MKFGSKFEVGETGTHGSRAETNAKRTRKRGQKGTKKEWNIFIPPEDELPGRGTYNK